MQPAELGVDELVELAGQRSEVMGIAWRTLRPLSTAAVRSLSPRNVAGWYSPRSSAPSSVRSIALSDVHVRRVA